MYPHERSLVERLKDKPFALLGVNSDRDLAKIRPRLASEKITWRSFWNGPKGTRDGIAGRFGVRAWPTIYDWQPLRPPVLVGPSCYYVQIASDTTGASYYASFDFLEVPTSDLLG